MADREYKYRGKSKIESRRRDICERMRVLADDTGWRQRVRGLTDKYRSREKNVREIAAEWEWMELGIYIIPCMHTCL